MKHCQVVWWYRAILSIMLTIIQSCYGMDLVQLNQQLEYLVHPVVEVEISYESLRSWHHAVHQLPEMLSARTASLISRQTYSKILRGVTQTLSEVKQKSLLTVAGSVPTADGVYAQKKIIESGTDIYVWGNLLGDIHTLIDSLKFLNDKDILSDKFVINGKAIFIFLGDYVGSRNYGVEVQAIIALLKQKNPFQVFLLRGYQEQLAMNKVSGGFIETLPERFQLVAQEKIALEADIAAFYESLPVVLYVGINDTDLNKQSYAQFCYGAIDVYDQQKLFADPAHYQSITSHVIPRVDKSFEKNIQKDIEQMWNDVAQKSGLSFGESTRINPDFLVVFSMIEAQTESFAGEVRSQFVQGIIKSKDVKGIAVSQLLNEMRVGMGCLLAFFLMRLPLTLSISALIHAQQENDAIVDVLHNNVKIDSYSTLKAALKIEKAPPIITLTSTPSGILYSRGFLHIETALYDSNSFSFTLLRSICLNEGESYQCGVWHINKYKIQRSDDRIVNDSAYELSPFKSKVSAAPSNCVTVPQGINNTEGTCFLNVILQLWRAIYCVPGIADEIVFSPRLLNPQEDGVNAAIYKAVINFLNNYSSSSPEKREKLLKIIHDALTKKDQRVGITCSIIGRAHLVVEIMHEALTKYPALIDCTKEKSEYFRSNIGIVLNSIECKNQFAADEKQQNLLLEGASLQAFKNNLDALFKAQSNQGYAAIQIARATGLDVFSGKMSFDWPLVLIVSTTRFNPKKNGFEKLLYRHQKKQPVNLHETVVQGSILSQFSVILDLSRFGFSSHIKKPPAYELMALGGKIIKSASDGHAVAIIKYNNEWFYCSNNNVESVLNGEKLIDEAARTGKIAYPSLSGVWDIYPEILVYRRKD